MGAGMNKTLRFAIALHRFAQNNGLDIVDAATIVKLAGRVFRAGERHCNEGTEASGRAYDRVSEDFREAASGFGFEADISGLWPSLRRDGQDIYIPCED